MNLKQCYSIVFIQFCRPSCGHHGPYAFYKAFTYRRQRPSEPSRCPDDNDSNWKTLSLGQFFYVKVLQQSAICVGELQLVWESSGGPPGQMLASIKLYYRPEDIPSGRQSNHGQVIIFLLSIIIVNLLYI